MKAEPCDLERLLDDMRAAILAGDLAALAPLGEAAEQMLRDPPHPTGQEAARLRAKAEQNMACLEAAGRGVRAAQRRIAEVRAAASGRLATYDAQGHKAESPAAATLVQRI